MPRALCHGRDAATTIALNGVLSGSFCLRSDQGPIARPRQPAILESPPARKQLPIETPCISTKGDSAMRQLTTVISVLALVLLAACSTAEERQADAEADLANKRVELMERYEECRDDADGDQQKLADCEVYLREAEALK